MKKYSNLKMNRFEELKMCRFENDGKPKTEDRCSVLDVG